LKNKERNLKSLEKKSKKVFVPEKNQNKEKTQRMGNQTSNIKSIRPILPRTSFFPTNLVFGNLVIELTDEIEYSCISVNLVGEIHQSFQVPNQQHNGFNPASTLVGGMFNREFKMTIADTVCTIIGNSGKKGKYRLQKGVHNYEFAFMLPPQMLPTALCRKTASHGEPIETARVQYFVSCCVEMDGKSAMQGSIPIHIFMPIAASMWSQPSAIARHQELDLEQCCCCDGGKIKVVAEVLKSVVSLDRDSIAFRVSVDATASEEDVDFCNVSLVAFCSVRAGQHPVEFRTVVTTQKVGLGVKKGAQGQATGALQLNQGASPTIQSSIFSVTYKCVFDFDFEYADPVSTNVDLFVAHVVDETNNSANLASMQQQGQILQSGRIEVPNLLNPLYANHRPPALQDIQSIHRQMMMGMQQQQPQQQHMHQHHHFHHHHHAQYHHHHQQMQQQQMYHQHHQHQHQHHFHHHHHHHHHHQQPQPAFPAPMPHSTGSQPQFQFQAPMPPQGTSSPAFGSQNNSSPTFANASFTNNASFANNASFTNNAYYDQNNLPPPEQYNQANFAPALGQMPGGPMMMPPPQQQGYNGLAYYPDAKLAPQQF
jgi:hypothetical protein